MIFPTTHFSSPPVVQPPVTSGLLYGFYGPTMTHGTQYNGTVGTNGSGYYYTVPYDSDLDLSSFTAIVKTTVGARSASFVTMLGPGSYFTDGTHNFTPSIQETSGTGAGVIKLQLTMHTNNINGGNINDATQGTTYRYALTYGSSTLTAYRDNVSQGTRGGTYRSDTNKVHALGSSASEFPVQWAYFYNRVLTGTELGLFNTF